MEARLGAESKSWESRLSQGELSGLESKTWRRGQLSIKAACFPLLFYLVRSDRFHSNNFNTRDQPVNSSVPPGLLPSTHLSL